MTLSLNQNPTLGYSQIVVDEASTQALGKVFWKLSELWGLTQREQALVLGVKFHGTKLKEWQQRHSIPQDPDKFRRVGQMAGIHKNLRILFPYNREAVYQFMKTPQSWLPEGKSPMQLISEGGELRSYAYLAAIRRHLDQLRSSH